MNDTPIRVGIADDQPLIRMGLRMTLEPQPDITVVAEAENGREAIDLAARGEVDVMLMDVRMPELDGIAATEQITAHADAPKVLVLTTFDLDEYAFAAIRAGASGFLLKDARPEELLAAIRSVHAGDAALAPSVTKRMLDHFTETHGMPMRDEAAAERIASLTARERELFAAIAEGLSNDELAERFFLARSTVKTHISRILQKLHARDRVQLVILAYEHGIAS